MKVINSPGEVKITLVCCVHGNEAFGARVFRYYRNKIAETRGLRVILANEEALANKSRCIEVDLNRNFPGDPEGKHEQRLAAQLLPVLQEAEVVIDIHTTASKLIMTPIVANLSPPVKRVINLTGSSEVVTMKPSIVRSALIGNVSAGLSLEFNTNYAKTPESMIDLVQIVDRFLAGEANEPVMRRIFNITQAIPRSIQLPEGVVNFRKPTGHDFYPFLPNGKSYATHRGFAAATVEEVRI